MQQTPINIIQHLNIYHFAICVPILLENKRLHVEIPAPHIFHFALEITTIIKLMHIVPMYIFDPFTLYMYIHKQNINVLKFFNILYKWYNKNSFYTLLFTLSMVYKICKCVHVNICKHCTLNSVQYSTVLNRATNLSITLVMKFQIVSKLSLPQKKKSTRKKMSLITFLRP